MLREEISNFIKTIMEKDLEAGFVSEIVTRFPPNQMHICILAMPGRW
jgi:hypothetical protein